MTTSQDLIDVVHAAIVFAGTDAEGRVFKPGDWPSQPDQYPIIKLRLAFENRQSLGRSGPPQFTTVATIQIQAEVSEPAQIDNDGATEAEARLWAIKRQIDAAVVNSYPLTTHIQQISAMRAQLAFTSDAATHLAGVQIDLDVEFYEGIEDFPPAPEWPLSDLAMQDPVRGVGIVTDLNT